MATRMVGSALITTALHGLLKRASAKRARRQAEDRSFEGDEEIIGWVP